MQRSIRLVEAPALADGGVRGRSNQALLRIAGQTARLGGWTLDFRSRALEWSDEVCAIHELPVGYVPTLEEGISYYLPEQRVEIRRCLAACERDGTPYDLELSKLTATGRRIWVRTIGVAVRDESGAIVGLQGAFQDITPQHEVARELARTHRALQLLSSCNEAMIRGEREQELLQQLCRIGVEEAGYRMAWVGLARDDARKTLEPIALAGACEGYFDHLTPSWSAAEPWGCAPCGRAVRDGQLTLSGDIANDPFTGPWREAALSRGFHSMIALPMREGGRTFGVLVLYAEEISEALPEELVLLQRLADNLSFGILSLRARAAQREAQRKLAQQAALLEHATDAIYVHDLEGGLTSWNRAAGLLYGWHADEALRRAPEALVTRPEGLAAHREALRAVLASGEWSGEQAHVTRAGRPLTIEARWTLLRDEAGRPKAVLAINTDVTEKRRLESHALRSQRMESIGTLAGGIAHDLNNVLAPILMSVAELKDLGLPEGDLALLDTLERSALRGAELIKQLLTFARGEDEQRSLVDPSLIVAEVQALVRDTFPRDLAFSLSVTPAPWGVHGNATELHQVLMNLCVNARDAMPGGGRLSVGLENVRLRAGSPELPVGAAAGDWVLLSVSDTGPGIAPELRERIFEPFFTTKQLGQGTGLGLSTTLNIVKRLGGFIALKSGPGATFKVYLPAVRSSQPAGRTPAEAPLPRGRDELVLVVDDEPGVRSVAKKILERYGYRVLLASGGEEALLHFAAAPSIALMLTDLSMPGMDGATLISALKARAPSVHVVCSSGYASDLQLERVRAAGVERMLSKPYTAEGLLREVDRALHGGS